MDRVREAFIKEFSNSQIHLLFPTDDIEEPDLNDNMCKSLLNMDIMAEHKLQILKNRNIVKNTDINENTIPIEHNDNDEQ